ncbi:ABC transporter permease [Paludibacterium paludis]|uniref:ABC transporter permease n=1 Tax=Paludibacterium paludis TaxID=1225769 RepID=A0A918U7H0_9NEIS|nr:ABC transporter permease [Paludibacterium paludis]GGY05480.1 ABC transporter permease [Paludibacterium paludis]
MYILIEAFRSAWHNLLAHRLRSFLTTLGIVIGTASVVTVVALMQGFSDSIKSQFADLGGGALTISAQNDFDNFRTGNIRHLKLSDIDLVRFGVEGIAHVAPTMSIGSLGTVRYRGRSTNPSIFATTAEYVHVERKFPRVGRFLVDGDDKGRRRVAVLGSRLAEDLKMPANPVGEFIQLGNEWVKVIGVMEKRGEIFGMSQDNYAIIPFNLGHAMHGREREPVFEISFTVASLDSVDRVRERVERVLRAAHRLRPSQEDDFKVAAADQLLKQFDQIASMATLVLGGVVGISMLVGGIGIMTVMLVSVTERTREIGILKAIGATRRDILIQFLMEAGLLSLFGGVVGIALGVGLAKVVALMIPNFPPATVPVWVALGAALFCALVGVVFGIMPASKAANLDPIEALRYE